MTSNLPSVQLGSEISLIDIIKFVKESWKSILSFTIFGILLAALSLWSTPKKYEASALIKMAQFSTHFSSFNNSNTLGINIEEPQTLIARMALPTSYSKETIALCGLAYEEGADARLAKMVELSIPKGLVGIVALKIISTSKETARVCANAVFLTIKSTQAQLIATYINDLNTKLVNDEERLNRIAGIIAKVNKSEGADIVNYLATREEIRFLLEQISNLQGTIISEKSHVTRLVAPIYLNNKPLPQKPFNILLFGLLLGCLLGILLALARKLYQSNRLA
jgi:LPS O-antigen subunit length determinant protein (WzzB/FepE family)